MTYLLDSNVFIEGAQRYYGFDICPAFWDWLIAENADERVYSIEKVANELTARDDELSRWAEKRGESFYLPPDQVMLDSLAVVSQWASSQRYSPDAVSRFLEGADYYLVAHAHAHGYTVVTLEKPAPSIHNVKIPNACIALNVKVMNPFEMLRKLRARFVLAQSS